MDPPHSLSRHDRFWAGILGCTPEDLLGCRTVVAAHGPPLTGDCVVWVLRLRDACVVSVPPPMAGPLSPLAERHSPDEWFDRQFLLDVLRHPVRGIAGPLRLGASHPATPGRWHTPREDAPAPPGFREYARYYAIRLQPACR